MREQRDPPPLDPLKACTCGGDAERHQKLDVIRRYWVECRVCHRRTWSHDSPWVATSYWNTDRDIHVPTEWDRIGLGEWMILPQNYDQLTIDERRLVREEYRRRQNDQCHFCRTPLVGPPAAWVHEKPVDETLFPENFFRWPVHLHHSHKTGMTIGAVHALCNAVLWQHHGE